jgi:hypothetical protein
MNRLVIAPSILVADFGPPAEEVPVVDAWTPQVPLCIPKTLSVLMGEGIA